jgi:hypothetical protein
MKDTLSIIGRGTVGCLNALKFSNLGYDINWYQDPHISPLSVGEGADLSLSYFLSTELNFSYEDLIKIGGYHKHGIEKINWGKKPFTHWFELGRSSIHINATNLQDFIIDKVSSKVNIIEKHVKHSELESYIIDCSGKPPIVSERNVTPIPVDSAYVTQCPWDNPKFSKTLCVAQEHGWVFLIPLQDRCSVGYLYNSNFIDIETIKTSVNKIFNQYNLTPLESKSLSFNNFYRKNNFRGKFTYNGNSSFFLEPIEATSLNTAIDIIGKTDLLLKNKISFKDANEKYKNFLEETIDIVMLHYLVDPPFDSPFWKMANKKAVDWFTKRYKEYPKINIITQEGEYDYSTWYQESFKQNLKGLNLYNKLNQIKNG